MSDSDHRGGGRYGAVIAGSGIVSGRFVYLTWTDGRQDSWRIRDFIASRILSSESCRHIELAQIQRLIERSHDDVPRLNAETEAEEWRSFLIRISQEAFESSFSADSLPVLEANCWKQL